MERKLETGHFFWYCESQCLLMKNFYLLMINISCPLCLIGSSLCKGGRLLGVSVTIFLPIISWALPFLFLVYLLWARLYLTYRATCKYFSSLLDVSKYAIFSNAVLQHWSLNCPQALHCSLVLHGALFPDPPIESWEGHDGGNKARLTSHSCIV